MSDYDFDATYSAITGERVTVNMSEAWAPDVTNVPHPGDVDVMGEGWHVLTSHTGQYGYNGAVMHPSESADDETVRRWVREAGGDWFAIVEVRDDDGSLPDGDPIGWAIAYRKAQYTHQSGEPVHVYDGMRVDIDGEVWSYSDTHGWQCAAYADHVALRDAIDSYDFIELTTKGL